MSPAWLLVGPHFLNRIWPWQLTPLVARIIGVWLTSLAAAFVWSVWDGDASRTRPIFLQGLPTAVLVGVVPLADRGHLGSGAGRYALCCAVTGTLALAGVTGLLQRPAPTSQTLQPRPEGRAPPASD